MPWGRLQATTPRTEVDVLRLPIPLIAERLALEGRISQLEVWQALASALLKHMYFMRVYGYKDGEDYRLLGSKLTGLIPQAPPPPCADPGGGRSYFGR